MVGPLEPGGDRTVSAHARRAWKGKLAQEPVVEKAAAWMAERDAIDAMMLAWQDHESALLRRTEGASTTPSRDCPTDLPEARAMRALERKIKLGLRRLHRMAQVIANMPATTAEGALAKIRLGLRVQGQDNWNADYACSLVTDGYDQLERMFRGDSVN